MTKSKTKQKLQATNSNYHFNPTLFLLLNGSVLALLYFCSNNTNPSNQLNSAALPTYIDQSTASICMNFFSNQTYGLTQNKSIKTTLIKEYHGQNEHEIADCLDSLLTKDDHLLLESPNNGLEISCDSLQPAYKRFNGKAKCYGADLAIDEARRRYADSAWRANFISQKMSTFFITGLASKDIIKNIINFAEMLRNFKDPTDNNVEFTNSNVRNGKYLKQLALKMRGLDIKEMQAFLVTENNMWADKANYYEKLSRSGPTNQALNEQISIHQKQLANNHHKLFVVYGANHLNFEKNKGLKKLLEESDVPITILSPRKSIK